MEEKIDFNEYLKNLDTEWFNPFRKKNFSLGGAESFIKGGSEFHHVDNVMLDFSSKLRAKVCFRKENVILTLAIISMMFCSHCTLDNTITVHINNKPMPLSGKERALVFEQLLNGIRPDGWGEVELVFRDDKIGLSVYNFHKQNILFTTDYYRLEYDAFEKEMDRRLKNK